MGKQGHRLLKKLTRHKRDGYLLEKITRTIFEHDGYTVSSLGKPVDLIAIKGDSLIAIECKNYAHKIPNSCVDKFRSNLLDHYSHQTSHGIIVSCNYYFPGAKRSAMNAMEHSNLKIDLYDINWLVSQLRKPGLAKKIISSLS